MYSKNNNKRRNTGSSRISTLIFIVVIVLYIVYDCIPTYLDGYVHNKEVAASVNLNNDNSDIDEKYNIASINYDYISCNNSNEDNVDVLEEDDNNEETAESSELQEISVDEYEEEKQDDISKVTSIKELQEKVQASVLAEGKTSIDIPVKGLTEKEIKDINYGMDTTYAKSKTYTLRFDDNDDIDRVTLNMEVTDSYYVYRNKIYGEPIPEEKTRSIELLYVLNDFIEKNIADNMTDYEKELAIHDYLVESVTYGNKETYNEDEHSVYGALINHTAVCEGYAKAFKLISDCCGIVCIYVEGDEACNHAWDMVCIDDEWYHIDVTWDDPVGEDDDYISHAYFNVNDDFISQEEHTWDSSCYPVCTNMAMNYYVMNGKLFDYDGFYDYLSSNAYDGNYIDVAMEDYSDRYDIEYMVESVGYNGSWWYSWEFDKDSSGYQVMEICFE